jgi:hypothetical protein
MGSGDLTLAIFFALFVPFLTSLFGRDARWQAISLGFGIIALLWFLNSHDVLALVCWMVACAFSGAAIWARVSAK